ncbi:LOW QUALITY PROTEIN: granulocyte-macrophage colony-stimulating factor receptor subunit alpha [Panthera leo]|uniref:LOW QUALITY PROTEIN: granulocyte-macrophage colony-stimulating factor receptor subunit alpha n=1 Tax=Panthera leo TaxID=9689 RepID=UPI001C6A1555|nr:LOW QUALITY PROTEIN: granulocyte-macrophage colony-stimulating factor receptor subunit alpha [Panthera leo]
MTSRFPAMSSTGTVGIVGQEPHSVTNHLVKRATLPWAPCPPPLGLPRPPSRPLGPWATTILFCMLLDPALPLTQEHQDVPTTELVPSLNMKFDRRTMELSWDCKENTTYLECVMIHKEKGEIRKKPKNKDCHCNFSHDSLHGGITFVVKVNSTQGPIPEKLVYANPGGEGTAAQNFSCFIYNVNFMNCTWAKGQAAPDDVQYFLYILDFKEKRERECPHYVTDSGTHVGCHLHDLSGLTFRNYFLVNGTSRETAVQFFDTILSLKNIEIYSPPNNVSVDCNPSHCQILWDPPRTRHPSSAWDFNYQLRIQKQDNKEHAGNQLIDVTGKSENKYNFPSPEPRPKHTVTIRVSDARGQHWSAWSQPVEFGSTQATASFVHVYVLVVLGTFVCALILSCFVKRLFASETLFPRIPHIKDKWSENVHTDHQIIWEKSTPDTGKIDHEEILTVEEVTVAPESV